VPIVDAAMGDPIGDGLAPSLARPGGNLTGLSYGWSEGFGGKFLELIQEAVPADMASSSLPALDISSTVRSPPK
jgi:putative tryptophan/tyrosine transport system substrate-binding protein